MSHTQYPALLRTPWPAWNGWNTDNPAIDAVGEKRIDWGEIDWLGEGETKTIRALAYLINNKVGTTTLLRVGFTNPHPTDGPTMQDDGTWTHFVDVPFSSLTSYVISTTSDLGSFKTVTRGEFVMAKAEMITKDGGSDYINLQTLQATNPSTTYPGTNLYQNGAWLTVSGGVPNIAFLFTDGTWGYLRGGWMQRSTSYISNYDSTTAESGTSTSGNERGNRWIPTKSHRIHELVTQVNVTGAGSDFEVRLYVNGTLKASKAFLGRQHNATGSGNNARLVLFSLPTPVTVKAGDTVDMTVLATGANTISIHAPYGQIESHKLWGLRGEDINFIRRFNNAESGTFATVGDGAARWASIYPHGVMVEETPPVTIPGIRLPGQGMQYPRLPQPFTAGGTLTAIQSSNVPGAQATGRLDMLGCVEWADGQQHDISKVHFWATVNGAGTYTLRVSLRNVDAAAGNPPRGDATIDQFGTLDSGSVGIFGHYSVTLGAQRTVAHGERLAVCFDYSAYTSGYINVGGFFASSSNFPTCSHTVDGSTWANNSTLPLVTFEAADGTFGQMTGGAPALGGGQYSFNSSSTPDEYGTRFSVPRTMWVDGIAVYLGAGTGADFDVVLYEGTTALATASFIAEEFALIGSAYWWHLKFPSEVRLKKDVTYTLAIKPTTTTNVTVHHHIASANAHIRAAFGEIQGMVSRTDGGAWSGLDSLRFFSFQFDVVRIDDTPAGTNVQEQDPSDDVITPRGPRLVLPPYLTQTTGAAMDAADEMTYLYGELHGDGWVSGNKTITAIEMVVNRNGGNGSVLRAGFEDPNTGVGFPMRGDGTLDENGTVNVADITNTVNEVVTFTLGAPKVVSHREKVGVRVDHSDFSGGGSVFVVCWQGVQSTTMPSVSNYIGGAWVSRSSSVPSIAFLCSDGSRIYMAPGLAKFVGSAWEDFTSASTGTAGDERGTRWVPKAPWTITGLVAGLRTSTAGATGELRIFVNGVLQKTWTLSEWEIQGNAASLVYQTPQDAAVKVSVGDVVIAAFRPTNGTWRLYRQTIGLASEMIHFGPENDISYTTRVDEGAWYQDASWDKVISSIAFCGHPTPMIGTYQISGTVQIGGSPVGAGHVVRLVRQADNGVMMTETDGSGQYSFLVEPGFLYHAIAEVNLSGQRYNYRSLFDLTPVAS